MRDKKNGIKNKKSETNNNANLSTESATVGDVSDRDKSARRGRGLRRLAMFLSPVVIIAVAAVYLIYFIATGRQITVADIVSHAPQHALPAALLLVIFYILKSLSVFFPITVLYAAGGYIFGPFLGMLVNFVGVAAGCLVQLMLGRLSGADAAARLARKYPKMSAVFSAQERHPLTTAFAARLFGVISGDITSHYFGAAGMPVLPCIVGSMLGVAPGLISVTMLGTSADDPTSPLFIITVGIALAVFAAAAVGKKFYDRKHRDISADDDEHDNKGKDRGTKQDQKNSGEAR